MNEEEIRMRNEIRRKLKKAEKEARKEAIKNKGPFKGINLNFDKSVFDKSNKLEPGARNWTGFGFDTNPPVTVFSGIILIAFIALTLMFPTKAEKIFSHTLNVISKNAGWFFIASANVFVLSGVLFAISKYGNIRIGGADARPEFSKWAWYAMLISAGMGIGLVFWSVAEPISHLGTPPPIFGNVAPGTAESAQAAMMTTFFHWGIHPWGLYAIVGLGLAYFAYNEGLPLTIKSVFYPLIGNHIYGFWGHVIDILSVLATLTGLATSLGLGVSQINAGLNHLFSVNISVKFQVFLILGITLLATTSVVLGLDKGVKILSKINMYIAGAFLIFVLIAGPTVYILSGFTQNLGYYISKFVEMSSWTETFRDTNWQGGWTVFYWAWWISWSPFVGMFIARISKGRTVREFILGVMVVPSLLSFLFMSVFGSTAIFQQMNGVSDLITAVQADPTIALFKMLEGLPISGFLSIVGIILVTIFFVTSSDSGSLVVDHLISGGKLNSPVVQRVFWALMEGVVAATLLIGGGLTALQTASVITGLPFAIILLIMIYSLYQGLSNEFEVEQYVKKTVKEKREDLVINKVVTNLVNDDALSENTEL